MLKALELQGFKSFPEKTVLEFPRGIAAIVGPNGSGKSNLVDAIRWVLGEQSAKNIRVTAAQEVIFNGAAGQPASSLAWVSLIFDNHQREFNLDFDEVEIKRKVYRDGNSEYFLNKKQLRLKELTQLLAAARLGVKGLEIVNQGAGDVFLRANSLERREMIEEMIGLKELRLKKQEAERRIKETKTNLAQTEAILKEIEPNLRSLKRQVSRWQSRQEKQQQLAEQERFYFLEKICQLGLLTEGKTTQLKELETRISDLKQEIKKTEQQLLQAQQQEPESIRRRSELEQQLNQKQKQKAELSKILGRIEGQLELLAKLPETELNFSLTEAKEKFHWLIQSLEAVLSESALDSVKRKLESLIKELKLFLAQRSKAAPSSAQQEATLQQEKQRLLGSLAETEKAIEVLVTQLQALKTGETAKNQEFQTAFLSLQQKQRALDQLEAQLGQLRLEQEKTKLYQQELTQQLAEAGFVWETFLEENQALLSQRQVLAWSEERELKLAETEKLISKLRQELFLIGEIDPEVISEYDSINKRYQFLSGQKADLETALADLERLTLSLEEKINADFETALKAIGKEFQHYFSLIFEGGRAALKVEKQLEPQTQTLEFGIEIQVNLPRKKINSLEILSGGERALTAIAFLFAVINYARPLFLILDEIDAALDESNSRRLAQLLKEMAKEKTQFILITHNRAVMEAADVLYGVTMADGVSKIFSLKFAEAEQLARTVETAEG